MLSGSQFLLGSSSQRYMQQLQIQQQNSRMQEDIEWGQWLRLGNNSLDYKGKWWNWWGSRIQLDTHSALTSQQDSTIQVHTLGE